MKTAQKIAAFVVGLAAAFAVAVWVGKTAGPDGDVVQHAAEQAAASPEPPGGLLSSQDGYTLDLTESITVDSGHSGHGG